MGKAKTKTEKRRKNVITGMQIIHTWASFQLEHPEITMFDERACRKMLGWTEDALKELEGEER